MRETHADSVVLSEWSRPGCGRKRGIMWPMRSEMTRDECRKCLRCLGKVMWPEENRFALACHEPVDAASRVRDLIFYYDIKILSQMRGRRVPSPSPPFATSRRRDVAGIITSASCAFLLAERRVDFEEVENLHLIMQWIFFGMEV